MARPYFTKLATVGPGSFLLSEIPEAKKIQLSEMRCPDNDQAHSLKSKYSKYG